MSMIYVFQRGPERANRNSFWAKYGPVNTCRSHAPEFCTGSPHNPQVRLKTLPGDGGILKERYAIFKHITLYTVDFQACTEIPGVRLLTDLSLLNDHRGG